MTDEPAEPKGTTLATMCRYYRCDRCSALHIEVYGANDEVTACLLLPMEGALQMAEYIVHCAMEDDAKGVEGMTKQ